jgi:hypothetical protein
MKNQLFEVNQRPIRLELSKYEACLHIFGYDGSVSFSYWGKAKKKEIKELERLIDALIDLKEHTEKLVNYDYKKKL